MYVNVIYSLRNQRQLKYFKNWMDRCDSINFKDFFLKCTCLDLWDPSDQEVDCFRDGLSFSFQLFTATTTTATAAATTTTFFRWTMAKQKTRLRNLFYCSCLCLRETIEKKLRKYKDVLRTHFLMCVMQLRIFTALKKLLKVLQKQDFFQFYFYFGLNY